VKIDRKNSQANTAIENGLTAQFTNKVISSPAGLVPIRAIEARSTRIIMGTIIIQIKLAIGTLIWLPAVNSMSRNVVTNSGAQVPTATPATMQSPTQTVRYRSNRFSRFSADAGVVTSSARSIGSPHT